MRIFAAVVESAGVRAAARVLDLPRSVVSRRVAALEERLGVQLVRRSTRALQLTDLGQAYYERCSRILAECHAAEEDLRTASAEPQGTLRITSSQFVGEELLDPIVAEYLHRWPRARVEIRLTAERLDLVAEGLDLAIRRGALDDTGALTAKRLGTSELTCFASPDYIARRGSPETPADLAAHDCIVIAGPAGPPAWTFPGPLGPERVPVPARLRVNSRRMAYQAARSGLGITRLNRLLRDDDAHRAHLVELLPAYREVADVYAVYPRTRPTPIKIRAF
ncbi:MAG TPA: LysR family transcriptional regulator, partial [Candidatus Nanopelagicales bacterium]|nr:LysR family transcriptional regulator [Candidatus Nanopelagicales bacterium]